MQYEHACRLIRFQDLDGIAHFARLLAPARESLYRRATAPEETLRALETLCRWIDALNTWVGRGVAWATGLVVVVVFVDVVMRYAFNLSFVFTQELEWHLFGFIFLMGAGYTLLKDGHVRVDIFYQHMSPKAQAWVNLLGVLFFLIPGCLMIILTSLSFVANSWAVMEGSPDPGGIPYRFVLKACIPAGFGLVLLQGISLGIKSFLTILGEETRLGGAD